MPKNILLDTQTASLLDILGNGRLYRIPPYQRDYSWQEEQWEDLWADITEVQGRPEVKHYMGTLVLEADSDRSFVIIDGQQRLATLSILALAVIQRLGQLSADNVDSSDNQERADSLRSRFIGEKNPASLTITSKIQLNETDDPFYQDYLVRLRTPANVRRLPKSNRAMWNCYCFFRSQLANSTIANDGRALAELLNETVARQLLFIAITVDDELNAYTVFETLNARGVELSTTDLLKNFLFSRVQTQSDLKALQRRWTRLIQTVKQEKFPSFLRYHLQTELPKVRSTQLYKIVRDRIRRSDDVISLVDGLEQHAELFSALADASHEYWIDRPNAKPLIRERLLYRDQQSTPLFLAAWDKLSPQTFDRLLKLVNVITFRYTTISNLNTNELEPVYHQAANAVLSGQATSVGEIFERLKPIYVPDDRFERNYAEIEIDTSGQRKRLVRFILAKHEMDLSGNNIDFETDPATIEHILPENPTPEWDDFVSEDVFPRAVYRLGNLTLLERGLNTDIGNGLLESKTASYCRSRYQMTKSLGEEPPDQWTLDAIDTRQQQLARRAIHLWRSDHA
ncbi:MAG: DUF262 domain-containing HNH endonuclease family protein [Pirellulaceae bacterium]